MSSTSINENNLEKTVALVYQTLRKNQTRTLEMKKRNAKALEETSLQLLERQNRLGFTESLNFNLDSNKQVPAGLPKRHSSAVLNRQAENERSDSGRFNNHDKTAANSPIAPYRSPKLELYNPPSHLKSPKKNYHSEKERKTNPKKLKSIIFKTLDRIFHLPKSPSDALEEKRVGLDTLRKLTESEPDTLLRKPSIHPTCFENVANNDSEIAEQSQHATKSPKVETNQERQSLLETLSTSSDDDSWTFVPAPLRIEEVELADSLEYANTKQTKEEKVVIPNENSEESGQYKRKRYVRKHQNCNENKIKKRFVDRQREKEQQSDIDIAQSALLYIPAVKAARPDSPLQAFKDSKKISSVSLPNLSEEATDTESLLSHCGTDSFLRGAALRPSSTLSKSVPSFPDLLSNFSDDDLCSSSSSFASFQAPDEKTIVASIFKPTIPSALCKDVQVNPIVVDIAPWNQRLDGATCSEALPPTKQSKHFKDGFSVNPEIESRNNLKNNVIHISSVKETLHEFTNRAAIPSIQNQKDDLTHLSDSDDISVVVNEFAWMVNENEMKEPTVEVSFSNQQNSKPSEPSSNELLNSSIPPPPPPMPMGPTSTYRTLRELPLTVFTNPQSANTIFTNLGELKLEEKEAKKLKENFPLKKSNSDNPMLSLTKNGKNGNDSGAPKFKKLNIEIFLKTWSMDIDRLDALLESIGTLNTNDDRVDVECIAALSQVLPKMDEIEVLNRRKRKTLDNAERFVVELAGITRIKEKLQSMQFSIDFQYSFRDLVKRIRSFILACEKVNTSKKFLKIIEGIMALLRELNSGGTKIYGFDIQSLYKLAAKTSQDGSTTMLHFLIEYIQQSASLKDSIDFYVDFQELADVAKTSLKGVEEQIVALKKGLTAYKEELEQTLGEREANNWNSAFKSATSFQERAESSIKELDGQLNAAKQAFLSCKERYGLTHSNITEITFFESLSDFLTAYRRIHLEIIEKNRKQSRRKSEGEIRRRKECPTPGAAIKKSAVLRRQSCGPVPIRTLSEANMVGPTDEIHQSLYNFLEWGARNGSDAKRLRRTKKVNM